jgi:hypothetical protein
MTKFDLINPDDVCQEGQGFDLGCYEIHKHFFVKRWTSPGMIENI